MAKYILEGAGNINWMAIFALLTFVIIFTVSALLAFRKNNPVIKRMENLPLDDDA
ncbi:MAG: hypothetical protein KAX53_00510 [Saprospiraceae bacterium]|jgi:hypothetical protein|nr:hypothetical protein [Saprospiraceae bacterium]MBK6664792.1 hypothetical protein [Saprospiraceae bacterium]MBK7698845.1 hypothetical protein [Saprospiraceae bacterium]MBK8826474.1 hypothetical protein [Saprospiraceae bacterium]MBK8885183.1 hypothetical protein [Saprospiraceae bacterium]